MNKEVGFQKEELLKKSAFSADDFAAIKLPGLPGTSRAWRDLLKATEWPSRAVRSRGRGGLKHEYEPPPELLEVMRRCLKGEQVTEDEVAIARAARQDGGRSSQPAGPLDEHGRYVARVAAHHDMGKAHPAMAEAVGRARDGLVVSLPEGAGKTKSMTRLMAQALSSGFTRAIFLIDASQAELLMLGNRTVARLEEESARRQLELDALVGDPDILDAALRLEWLLMQREPQASPADHP